MKPVAWIKIRELLYMQAVQEYGKDDWQTNLGLKPEPDDEGLYTETQVQELKRSFEQSVTDPENQPSQYGTVPMKEWVGLTTEEIYACDETSGLPQHEITNADLQAFAYAIEAKLKEKNTSIWKQRIAWFIHSMNFGRSDDSFKASNPDGRKSE